MCGISDLYTDNVASVLVVVKGRAHDHQTTSDLSLITDQDACLIVGSPIQAEAKVARSRRISHIFVALVV